MQVRRSCSRLLVIYPALPFDLEFSVRFAQFEAFLLVLRSDLGSLARNKRTICIISKSHVLCFQILVEFVSTVFVFSRLCHSDPERSEGEESGSAWVFRRETNQTVGRSLQESAFCT